MSRRHDVQDGSGVVVAQSPALNNYVLKTVSPTNGAAGYQVGCIWVNTKGINGTTIWANIGTSTSSQWVDLENPDGGLVTATAAFTATPLTHAGRTVILSLLAGFAVTMPAATGSGLIYRFAVGIVVTSGSYAISCPANTLFGTVVNGPAGAGGACSTFTATTTTGSTSVTLDAVNKGGKSMGDWVSFQDVAASQWFCTGVVTSGTPATPFA
jgi:hypothetical protein